MGVTIHYAVGSERGNVKSILNRAEAMAKEMKVAAKKAAIPFNIRRADDFTLLVDIGECETLVFEFKTLPEYVKDRETNGWNYSDSVLLNTFAPEALASNEKHLADWPDQRMYWASGFCKTQFAESVAEHRMVAELIRCVSSFCSYSHVYDEGDYFHTGNIADAEKSIGELGVMMNGLAQSLSGLGFEVRRGGETKVKPRKRV